METGRSQVLQGDKWTKSQRYIQGGGNYIGGGKKELKLIVGHALQSRLYRGKTTNFRDLQGGTKRGFRPGTTEQAVRRITLKETWPVADENLGEITRKGAKERGKFEERCPGSAKAAKEAGIIQAEEGTYQERIKKKTLKWGIISCRIRETRLERWEKEGIPCFDTRKRGVTQKVRSRRRGGKKVFHALIPAVRGRTKRSESLSKEGERRALLDHLPRGGHVQGHCHLSSSRG